jgi:hypothetical protein
MLRAFTIFLAGLIVVIGFGAFARDVLGLGCVGPVLPVWGCLAAPLPDTLPGNLGLVWYLFLAGVGFAICYIVRDIVYLVGRMAARRLFPKLAAAAGAQSEPPKRTYRIR